MGGEGRGKRAHLQAGLAALEHARLDGVNAEKRVAHVGGAPPRLVPRDAEDHLRELGALEPVLALQGLDAGRAAGSNVQCEAARSRDELRIGTDGLVHKTGLLGAGSLDGFGRQDELETGLQADETRQTLGATKAGDDAELKLGEADLRGGCAHARVARDGDLAPAAESHAADGRDGGLGARLEDGGEGLRRARHGGLHLLRGLGCELGDVKARAEVLAVARHDDGADLRVGV